MNLRSTLTLLALLTLAGCTSIPWGPAPCTPCAVLDVNRPQVTVEKGKIAVDQEVLVFLRKTPVTVTWQLPKGAGFSFPENGIVIEGKLIFESQPESKERQGQTPRLAAKLDANQKEIVECRRKNDLEFTCLNRNTTPGLYKYTIRVLENGKLLEPLDPYVMN